MDMLSDDPRVAELVNIAVKVVADPLRAELVELRRELAERTPGRILADACKPWEHCTGEPPEYDSPLHEVYCAGAEKAVSLLASALGVKQYTGADGSDSFDGDLGGTLANIVKEWRAEQIYNTWRDQPGFVSWVPGGNSDMQWKARDQADDELHGARLQHAPATPPRPESKEPSHGG